MDIILYYAHNSRAVRPRWLLEELELPYQLQKVDIFGRQGFSKAYRSIHPHGAVPVLEIDGKLMIESGAICHWLGDRFLDKQLAPAVETSLRMEYEQWMFYIVATLEPVMWQIVQHRYLLPEKRRVSEIIPWAQKQLAPMLNYINKSLHDREFLLGSSFSTADIMLGYLLGWTIENAEQYTMLEEYRARLHQRPAYLRATSPCV